MSFPALPNPPSFVENENHPSLMYLAVAMKYERHDEDAHNDDTTIVRRNGFQLVLRIQEQQQQETIDYPRRRIVCEGQQPSWLRSYLPRKWHVLLGLLFLQNLVLIVVGQPEEQDFTCILASDRCPNRQNNVCESKFGPIPSLDPSCFDGDCFDCSEITCGQFHGDCSSCASTTGCYWCPGDATCWNFPYEFEFPIASCNARNEYFFGSNAVEQCTGPIGENRRFSDHLYPAQAWIFDMVQVYPVWENNITGKGVRVRINDDGVDESHSEFQGMVFNISAGCTQYAPLLNKEGIMDSHGTLVASIIAGQWDQGNQGCGVGMAPDVEVSACNVFANGTFLFVAFDEKLEDMDISQNSIGIPPCLDPNEILVRRRSRNLQGDDEDDDNDHNCPFLPDSPPCQTCDFSTTPLSTICQNTIAIYCQGQMQGQERICLDFLDLFFDTNLDCDFQRTPPSMLNAIARGIQEGRDGKGIIYVFSSGNEFELGSDVNFVGTTNSRFTITVGAVGKDGKHASYSTPGAAVLVSAPGGDFEFMSNFVGAVPGDSCDVNLVGTSFSSPIVTGIVAFLLEVNPELTWRDVQGILIETSSHEIANDTLDDSMVTNGANYKHSNLYGFGIVNAHQAVLAAETWDLFCDEEAISVSSGLINLSLTNASAMTPSASILSIEDNHDIDSNNDDDDDDDDDNNHNSNIETDYYDDFIVESASVWLDLQHLSRGDLQIQLISPSGTESVLTPGRRPENSLGKEQWKLMTLRNWGESPMGNWTLFIQDLRQDEDQETCIDYPYNVSTDIGTLDCASLQEGRFCVNGAVISGRFQQSRILDVLTVEYEGKTLSQACCACGGGETTDDVEDRLLQWRLVLYGRREECGKTNNNSTSSTTSVAPSAATTPVGVPSNSSTVAPSPRKPTSIEGKVERDPFEMATTIGASITALILAFCWLAFMLGDPRRLCTRRGSKAGAPPPEAATGGNDNRFKNIV